MMKESENSGIDNEQDKIEGDAENGSDNVRKNMKGELDQVHQLQNTGKIDSFIPTEAAIKVGRIPLIVIHLLKCIKNRDLLQNCRLVSKEWRDWSTEILRKRKTFQIYSRRPENFKKFTARSSKLYKIWNLTQLTTFLTTSKTFPCAHFVFDGNLKKKDAQEFLTKFGSRVKGIKLIGPQNLYLVRKLLVEQIPQVESLELERFVAGGNSNSNSNSGFRLLPKNSPVSQLSSLTFLKLGKGNSPELILEILDSAPNLQECFGIRLAEEIEWLRHSNRLHILKGLKLTPGKDLDPQRLEKILSTLLIPAESCPRVSLYKQLHLTVLKVNYSNFLLNNFTCETRARFCSIVSKLLAVSQTTLKQLKFAPDSNSEGLIEWSTLKLEKVEKLTLSRDLKADFARLFLQILPNLHKIHLKNIHHLTDEHVRMFQNLRPIPTVKSLIVSGVGAEVMTGFARLLPNVIHLFVKNPRGPFLGPSRPAPFSKLAPIIWRMMRGLKSLQLEFNCPADEIDAGFTGMEIETCKLVRTLGGEDEFQMKEIDTFRVNPSILNLTELEALFLPGGFIEDENPKYNQERGRHDAEKKKATFISFKYAFKLMPKLRVFAHADN